VKSGIHFIIALSPVTIEIQLGLGELDAIRPSCRRMSECLRRISCFGVTVIEKNRSWQ